VSAPFVIKRAERTQARLRIALAAPSGAGKTWSGLELARGIVEAGLEAGLLTGTIEGKVGVIDTERESASLYSHLYPFDVIPLDPPYTVDRYIGALQTFERAGYAVVLIDQMSHAWVGAGGIMEQVQKAESRNAMAPWLDATPEQNRFVDTILASPCHIIANMRAKTAWVLEEKEKGGRTVKVPKRVGLGIVQRPGIEFEFTTVLGLTTDTHVATPIKDRTNLFPDDGVVLSSDWGRRMVKWMLSAKTPDAAVTVQATPLERCEAIARVSKVRIARCETMPDLIRVFTDVNAALKAFAPSVDADAFAPIRDALVAAKDARKLALVGVALPDVPFIDVDDAMALEQMLQAGGVQFAKFGAAFGVQRLGVLPADRLTEAAHWIFKEAQDDIPIPAQLQSKGVPVPEPVGGIAGLKSDLPWED